MRSRVLVPLMICLFLAVVALAVPALTVIASDRTQRLILERSASIDRFTILARSALDNPDAKGLERHLNRYHALYSEAVLVVDSTGTVVASTGELDPASDEVQAHIAVAGRNLAVLDIPPLRPWGPDHSLISAPILADGDLSRGTVVMRVDTVEAKADLSRRWALLLFGAVALMAVLAGLALWWTRWVLRPVRQLDEAAMALAEGKQPEGLEHTGPPELRRLAGSFDTMARTVSSTLQQQRDLVADASHQLRNPLAAVRLRVDSIMDNVDAGVEQQTLAAVTDDLDRLEHTLDRLLVLAEAEHRASATTAGTAVAAVRPPERRSIMLSLSEVKRRWQDHAAHAGAELHVTGIDQVRLDCRRSDLDDMLGAVIENALKYAGAGATVTVAVRNVVGRERIRISVSDDGPGLDDEEISQVTKRFWRSSRHRGEQGTGLGLAIVDQLARGNAGTAVVDRAPEGGLRVSLEFGGGHATP
ncbi:MAG: sensor histidine kinase [Propionibacteriaceae bacterium]